MSEASNVQPPAATERALGAFLEVCGDALKQMFQQSGQPTESFTSLPLNPAEPGAEARTKDVILRFTATDALEGSFVFHVTLPDAVRIAQVLIGEAPDGASEFKDEHRDACGEFFRQAAGLAATASKALAGGTVGYQFQAEEKTGASPPAFSSGWTFPGVGKEPLVIRVLLDAILVESLSQKLTKAEEGPSGPPPIPQPVMPGGAPMVTEANLGILLDVVLDASLRFGQKQMLLKDVLELRPGSIVELDRQVQDPAELLVAGRVIAKGEVVVVDGNYGLRIIEVAQPRDRLESLEA